MPFNNSAPSITIPTNRSPQIPKKTTATHLARSGWGGVMPIAMKMPRSME
jgi:hypothetical protein